MRILSIAFALMVMTGSVTTQATGDLAYSVLKKVEKRIIEDFLDKRAGKAVREPGKGKTSKKANKTKKWNRSKWLPPGLAREESLPPGLSIQLEKYGTLPPGLANHKLPKDLANMLPLTDKDSEWIIVDNNMVFIE